jgi:DNA-binding NtrC family response regulator
MRDCTALLMTTAPSLIEAVEQARDPIPCLRLEVCGELAGILDRQLWDDVALVLVHLTGADGETDIRRFIGAVAACNPSCSIVVVAERYQDDQAVAVLRAGATDYLKLPLGHSRLTYLLDTLTLRARVGLRQNGAGPEAERGANRQDPFHFVLAPEMAELMEQILRVGPQDTTLLFTGETGTGKTRLARLVHELSPRRDEPFLVIDCGALSPSLIESEMFGHVKGAFTGADRHRLGKFAAAGRGTLLLDEINSLPRELQGKLLRAVDEHVFEPVGANEPVPLQARLIAASNSPLDREVAEGRFRTDLYYRLNVVGFYLPPLRERPEAIVPLANKFVAELAARNGRPIHRIAPEALRALRAYNWPGNIRELRNVLERAVALCPGTEIQLPDLPGVLSPVRQPPARAGVRSTLPFLPARTGQPTLATAKEEAEIVRITAALERHGNNRLRAAAELGISRMALYKKLHKYGMMGTA